MVCCGGRPSDWPTELVDIAGFFFLDEPKQGFEPPRELLEFLQRDEEKPVFIGFGSLVISNAQVWNLVGKLP